MRKLVAREFFALKTIFSLCIFKVIAVFDVAFYTGVRFAVISKSAAGTFIFFSKICGTYSAVHPTGSNQFFIKWLGHIIPFINNQVF
jgi:hypothetical protein